MGYLGRSPTPSPIDTSDIPANSIDASKIIDGAIAVADVADNAITEDKIADAAVVSLKSGRKNLIINGGFDVWQRGTSTALTVSAYVSDRFYSSLAGATSSRFTVSKSSDAPDGASNSLKWECTTAEPTIGTTSAVYNDYRFEGQDVQQLAYGTSGAKSVTLSFWVKSNKVGTYVAWFYNATAVRHNAGTYAVDTADTWEKKTITITGDTVSAIGNTSAAGLFVRFVYVTGTAYGGGTQVTSWSPITSANRYADQSVNLADTVGNYIELANVQLELGSVATDFEHRSYGEELALCQRYYWRSEPVFRIPLSTNLNGGNDYNFCYIQHPVEMRVAPAIGYKDGDNNATKFSYHSNSYWSNRISNLSQYHALLSSTGVRLVCNPYTGFDAFIKDFTADAEL